MLGSLSAVMFFCVQTIFGKVCIVITIFELEGFEIIHFSGSDCEHLPTALIQ